MTRLFLLTDYKNRFGLKWNAQPYRSGYDHQLLREAFAAHGYEAEFVPLAEVFVRPIAWRGQLVMYMSSEELGNNYKTYVEDVVYGLEELGARLLPRFLLEQGEQPGQEQDEPEGDQQRNHPVAQGLGPVMVLEPAASRFPGIPILGHGVTSFFLGRHQSASRLPGCQPRTMSG